VSTNPSTTPRRAALYVRVSTVDQSNALQIRELKEYVERRGWDLMDIYQDQLSGAKASRPGLDRLMADARRRRFDAVLVYKLDRFGRSLLHCIAGIQELQSLGIRFVAVTQGIDTDESNPASKLLMHILAAVAQFERELIRERVSAGIKTAKARGTRSGRAIGRPRVIVDRQRVIQLRLAGASWATIGKALEVPSTTARRAYRETAPLPKPCVRETVESMRKQRAAGD
jgi:putative DNA-invertase from lambdoid prophage Rac